MPPFPSGTHRRKCRSKSAQRTDELVRILRDSLHRELLEAAERHERVQQGALQKFSFDTPADIFWKLYWEIARLHHATPRDPIDMKCFAFNAAVTAWQLTDWVFHDLSQEKRRKLKVTKLSDLQNLVREQCRALHLCRQIAVASKHRVVTGHFDPSVSTRVDIITPVNGS